MKSDKKSNNNIEDDNISYKMLLKFFLPLGLTPLIISVTHSVVDASIARLPYPVISLGVYGVVKSVTHMIAAPSIMCRQLFTSMVKDKHSYQLAFKFAWSMCFLFAAILFILSFTPAGGWFLRRVMGLTNPEEIRFAYIGLRITWLLPVSEVLRNSNQGLLISLEETNIMFRGILLRFVSISLFLLIAVKTQFTSGMVAGSLVWVLGIGLEGVFVVAYLYYKYGGPASTVENQIKGKNNNSEYSLNLIEILKFFIPLGFMMAVGAFIRPVIMSGIARSLESPSEALAAYGVGFGLILIIGGPIRMLHQCSLVYCESLEDDNWETVSRFCLMTGIVVALIAFVLGISYPGYWIFRRIIGVEEQIAIYAQQALLVFSIFPLVGSWREKYWGFLMNDRDTKIIGLARGLNIAAVVITLGLILGIDLLDIYPAVAGAWGFVIGQIVEGIVIWYYIRKNVKQFKNNQIETSI